MQQPFLYLKYMKTFFCLLLLFLLLTSCNENKSKSKVIIEPDAYLQQLILQDLDGNEANISNYLGEPLLINYWATWCRFCKIDFPEVEKFKKQHKQNINVVTVSDESLEKIKQYKSKAGFDFIYLKQNGSLSKLGVSQRPTYAYFDATGKHLETINGGVDLEVLKEMVDYHNKKD